MTKIFILCAFTALLFSAHANDECANAMELIPNLTCTNTNGTFSGMTMSGSTPPCVTGSLQDVWYKFTATDATMSVTLTAIPGLNHGFEMIQGGCGGTVLQCVNYNGYGNGEHYFNTNFIPGQHYYIRVFNASETISTAGFGICVRTYPSPANDLCANAGILIPNTTCNNTIGTFSGALADGGTALCSPTTSQDVWYRFIATDSVMSITLSAESGLNHGFELILGGCNGTVLQCVNSNGSSYGEQYVNNNFIPGQEYYVRVFNASSNASNATFGICVRKYPSPDNDYCTTATTLTPNTTCNLTYGGFSGAMMGGTAPLCGPTASQDVWYKFTATDSTMSIYLSAEMGLNHGFELIEGDCNGAVLQCINSGGMNFSEYYFNNNFIPGQEYYIRVFNTSASLTTLSFGICVRKYPSPVNDDCATATTLTPNTTCNLTYGAFSGAMLNGPFSSSCATAIPQDVWYKFIATDSTMSIYLSAEMGLNHGFELIEGGCNGTILQCINSGGMNFSEYYFNNNFVPGQEYYVRVFNASASLSAISFGICIRKYPSPANDDCATATLLTPNTVCNFTYGTFSGAMTGIPIPTCAPNAVQDIWYKFTATDSTMSILLGAETGLNHGFELIQGGCNGTVLQCVNNGGASYQEYYFNNNFIPGQEYYIRVFNASGSLTTASFGICVRKYPNPVNDWCTTATLLTPNTTCEYTYGTFSGAMPNGTVSTSCSPTVSQDVWYKFIATDSTMSILLGAETGLNHGFELIQGGCNGTVLQCVNNGGASYQEYYFNNNFIPGQEYYIRVFNTSASLTTAPFIICIRKYPNPANDWCETARELTPGNTCSYVSGTFSGAMMNGGAPSCAPSTSQDVWYKFTATATNMSVQLSSVSGLNHGIQVFEGSCNGVEIICRNQNGTSSSESASLTSLTVGYTYFVRVINASPELNTSTFSICLIGPPPSACIPSVVINTPVAEICQGTNVTFTATPTNGGTAPSYQWKVNGNNTGSNSAAYTSSTLTNGSIITCLMTSNAACASPLTATSNQVTMAVTSQTTPVFTQLPAICSGDLFTLPAISNNGISGTWSPAINNTETTTYTFTPNAGQCISTAVMTVTVNNGSTTPVFTPISAICSSESFSLPSISNNGISGTWSPAINNVETTTYTFTPNAGQCASTAVMTVTVNNGSTTPVFTPIPAICAGESFSLPSISNNGISGTWSPAINNAETTMYTFTPNAGQCASTTTMTVTVNNSTIPVFTPISAICSGESFSLPSMSNNGISGTWSPAVNNAVTTTYTFTPVSGQCVQTVTMTVVVNAVNTSVTTHGNTITAVATGATYQWISCVSGQPINGASNASFTPSEAGSYAVIVTQNGCTDTSNCILINSVGIPSITTELVQVYPNPFEQVFVLNSPSAFTGTPYAITDVYGNVVQTGIISEEQQRFSMDKAAAGVYFIMVNRHSIKLIKQY